MVVFLPSKTYSTKYIAVLRNRTSIIQISYHLFITLFIPRFSHRIEQFHQELHFIITSITYDGIMMSINSFFQTRISRNKWLLRIISRTSLINTFSIFHFISINQLLCRKTTTLTNHTTLFTQRHVVSAFISKVREHHKKHRLFLYIRFHLAYTSKQVFIIYSQISSTLINNSVRSLSCNSEIFFCFLFIFHGITSKSKFTP